MASGMARGAKGRGKRIAFGDRQRIIWDKNSEQIFRRNPNIAPPGAERDPDLEWIEYYKGHRVYNTQRGNRWAWNLQFRPIPGEVFFNGAELRNGKRSGTGFVVIEPNVPAHKSVAANKDWGVANYQAVADRLLKDGHHLVQFRHDGRGRALAGVQQLRTLNFRDALAVLGQARLYVGPEGGLHHGAAAVGRAAVVLFGGFIPPQVTGYDDHVNLTGGAEACGSINPCAHCKAALAAISVEEVYEAAVRKLVVGA